MRKLAPFFAGIIIFYAVVCLLMFSVNKYYDNKIKSIYSDSIVDGNSELKNQGLVLQNLSNEKKDSVIIYGSSELSTTDIYTHPSNMFKNNASGFQVSLVGRGYCQSIIHAINIAATDDNLRDKTMVIILSQQWFAPSGLTPEEFDMNFSELQFYSALFNKNIGSDIKLSIAARVAQLTDGSKNYGIIHQVAKLYSSKDLLSKAGTIVLYPYCKFKYYLLSIKDKVQSYNYLNSMAYKKPEVTQGKNVTYDWSMELDKASVFAKDKSNNNSFGIENNYYNKYVKDNLNSSKGIDKGVSYLNSPEYGDLELLLKICKSKGINPIFVSIPVQGKWYDYIGFSKDDRQSYYNKINKLISSYNFQILDLSSHEYDEHFLKDTMHLGWKGWIYIDKAIDEHYHSNK